MAKDEKRFAEKKLSLILNLMSENFFERMYDEMKTKSFESLDALDEFVDKALRKHYDEKDQIKEYYEKKYFNEPVDDDDTEDEEDFDEEAL